MILDENEAEDLEILFIYFEMLNLCYIYYAHWSLNSLTYTLHLLVEDRYLPTDSLPTRMVSTRNAPLPSAAHEPEHKNQYFTLVSVRTLDLPEIIIPLFKAGTALLQWDWAQFTAKATLSL